MDQEGTSAVEIEMDSPWGKRKVKGDLKFDVESRVAHGGRAPGEINGSQAKQSMLTALGRYDPQDQD